MAGRWRRRRAWTAGAIAVAATVAVVAVLAARGRQGAQGDADQRELQAYRLTMPKVRQMNDAYAAYFKGLETDPRFQALQKAREELSALEHKDELTAADERRIAELERQIDQAEDLAGLDIGEQQSLAEIVRAIESQPRFVTAIKAAGLTPREFAKVQVALFQAMFAYGFLKSGTITDVPKEVSRENVEFVRQHESELTGMARQWELVAGGRESLTTGVDEEHEENGEP